MLEIKKKKLYISQKPSTERKIHNTSKHLKKKIKTCDILRARQLNRDTARDDCNVKRFK